MFGVIGKEVNNVDTPLTPLVMMYSFSKLLSGNIFSKYHRKFLHFNFFFKLIRSVISPGDTFLAP